MEDTQTTNNFDLLYIKLDATKPYSLIPRKYYCLSCDKMGIMAYIIYCQKAKQHIFLMIPYACL